MKAKTDPRHQKRVDRMKNLFSYSFDKGSQDNAQLTQDIVKRLEEIDSFIQDSAPEWPLDQINRIDLAILRLSIFELLDSKTPYKVVIDEAVELAKEYGSENSSKFVNGVLGAVVEKVHG